MDWQSWLRSGLLALALMVLSCCGGNALPQGSPDFMQGYRDGCASGYSDAGWEIYYDRYRKDHEAYAASADYRRGWDEGHGLCYQKEHDFPHMDRPSL
jgi:hypothetical protein